MREEQIYVRVPGSTSNLGAGFDSLGLAVNRYLELEVSESETWQFDLESPCLAGLPTDQRNFIYETAAFVASEAGCALPNCRVKVTSELPLARGIGSSAAAIIAGIELADQLLELKLTKSEKFHLGCRLENHCDNLAASLLGGLVVTGQRNGGSRYLEAGVPDIEMVAVVPSYELKTSASRNILPNTLPFETAVSGSSTANMMIAAILQNDWKLAGRLMEEDIFHQPYRAAFVPNLETAMVEAQQAGAYGAALSGAGPAVMIFAAPGAGRTVVSRLKKLFTDDEVFVVHPDSSGVFSEKKIPFAEKAL
ncbi:MAG TPA: homoserine kinase [Bacillales bacterium]|nr:homoserine kinase [Bacillales bacterium]